jgi:hypothetical protein
MFRLTKGIVSDNFESFLDGFGSIFDLYGQLDSTIKVKLGQKSDLLALKSDALSVQCDINKIYLQQIKEFEKGLTPEMQNNEMETIMDGSKRKNK